MTNAERAKALYYGHLNMDPEAVHEECNRLLKALRSGTRRQTYPALRAGLRYVRAIAAERAKGQQ